uniref:BPTI/Kunitz inhibitor domain-containing protein n=1 Tax=Neogobius melanostomus TaxID=47308 RepID=A0A8C6WJ69_9GOBI
MEKCAVLLSVLVLVWTPLGKSAEVPDFCKLFPPDGPSCIAYIPQIFYNSTSQECEEFIYGGCGGNNNRFDSKKKCMETCSPQPSGPKHEIMPLVPLVGRRSNKACTLPPKTGTCYARMPRYFYNSKTLKCEIFIYGGCGGNDNRFVTARECQLSCHHKVEQPTETPGTDQTDICLLPPEPGPCEAYIPRYHYNQKTQKCEEFVYGGCHGNQNNFINEEECMKKCKKD